MAQVDVYNLKRERVGELKLDDSVFAVAVKEHLYYEMVKMQLANRRAGTASTKSRGEVSYSTAKLFKQKGTGRARRGSRRATGLRGGGTAFGPKPRSFAYKIPRSARKAALRSALSGRIAEKQFIVVDDFELPEIKTKGLIEVLDRFELSNALIVDDGANVNLKRSAHNLRSFKYVATGGVNVYDVLRFDTIIASKSSVEALQGALKK